MAARRKFALSLPNGVLVLGERTLIMGVLNVTPDSFSDGGRFLDPDRAVAHALQMQRAGADLIDLGGESARPGATGISLEEELRRVVPVLRGLKRRLRVPLSIDTTKPAVAEAALKFGAQMINDISGLRADPRLARVARRYPGADAHPWHPQDDAAAPSGEKHPARGRKGPALVGQTGPQSRPPPLATLDRPWHRLRQDHPAKLRVDLPPR
ncbi:dihydropteroate synthase, partial [Acidobacteriia bacterium AH_259_A11_L15]|nr:dihydropteroate synthase [Acidobacteriia bacterium AH_259_A11_L15]